MENVENKDNLNPSDSGSSTSSSSEMNKTWMKTLPKEFWKNETLSKYDSLSEAVGDLLKRPEVKEVPDSYGYGNADELFSKAKLTKEEADEIEKYYSSKMIERKPRKEIFGETFDEDDRRYTKAVEVFGKDLVDDIKKSGLDENPMFVKFVSRVGKELGSSNFNSTTKDSEQQKKRNYFEEILSKVSSK